ncbi:MAG: hypothetical protein LBJ72_09370 [Dysgonamonadaceae bacterium]|nr:hypothetical protein [Dysgonamonadaceae bacterium]
MTDNCKNTAFCCGAHDICEKGLVKKLSGPEIEYYDDEELDVFKGRASDCYTPEEVEQFREVFETMFASDVPGWLKSLELREVRLPAALLSEISK